VVERSVDDERSAAVKGNIVEDYAVLGDEVSGYGKDPMMSDSKMLSTAKGKHSMAVAHDSPRQLF